MKQLTDSIEIKTSPENAFAWFQNIEKNYKSWHPDHVSWKWTTGKPFEVGSVAFAKEYLHGKLHTIKSKIVKIKENELIEYENYYPVSIITPKGSFKFIKTISGCIFTATLTFRFGTVFSLIFKKQMKSVVKHMKEEGENLKRLLENQ